MIMPQFLESASPDFEVAFTRLLGMKREDSPDVDAIVAGIIADVRSRGDAAVIELTAKFDRLHLTSETLRFSETEIDAHCANVPAAEREALELAAERIRVYHTRQMPEDASWTDETGATLGWRWTAVEAAGLYVPGGLASYPSSVLMNAIPAKVAGVDRLAITVPTPGGQANPLVLLAARLAGVDEVEGHLHKDNFWHTLEVVDNTAAQSENVWLRLAALLHDIGKPPTKKFMKGTGWTFHGHEFLGGKMAKKLFRRLSLPLDARMDYVVKLIQMSSRPIAVVSDSATDSAVRRLLFDAGEDIEDLMILCSSDITTKNPRKKSRYLANYDRVKAKMAEVEARDHLRNWQPPIDGSQLMSWFDLPPGPMVGQMKTAVREAILDGAIPNTFDDAKAYVTAWAAEHGIPLKS
jgi:putative nucleotidyltransferase with HDIG domain